MSTNNNQGWICPRCETVNGPAVPTCFKCSSEDTYTSLSSNRPLTPKQLEVITAMQELVEEGKAANGTTVAEKLDITQSYASTILRKLIDLGYVQKEGYSFWLVKDTLGNPL